MKKLVLLLAVILMCLSFISAAGVEIKLDKASYYQSELLKAEILGFFSEDLKLENIAVYKEDQVHPIPTDSNILKLENKYLYYAVLPNLLGNYSLQIKNTEYWTGLDKSKETVIKNFTVASTSEPYLSVSPGFISATEDFSIIVKSINGLQEVTAKFKATGDEIAKEIGYNGQRTFPFSISGILEYTESSIEVGDISIPVYVYPKTQGEQLFINETATPAVSENKTEEISEQKTIPLEEATPEQVQTCGDINAKLCKKGEKCVGGTSLAKGGLVCCSGECEVREISKAWIIGIILLILLMAGLFWFYKKSKKEGKSKSREYDFEERARKFKDRMYPNLKPEFEVRRRLSKE